MPNDKYMNYLSSLKRYAANPLRILPENNYF